MRHFPGGFQYSSKETDGKVNINMTKYKSFPGRVRCGHCGERISLSPGGFRLKTLTCRGSISSAVQSVSGFKVFFSLICCSGWVSDGRSPHGNGHFYQGSCPFVHRSTFCTNTALKNAPAWFSGSSIYLLIFYLLLLQQLFFWGGRGSSASPASPCIVIFLCF